jgi:hypothetical protein
VQQRARIVIRWDDTGRPPSMLESSGHAGTLVLVFTLLAILALMTAAL